MACTVRPFGLSRRHFLGSALSAWGAALIAPGCGSGESGSSPGPAAARSSNPAPFAASAAPSTHITIEARVPGALVFPGRRRTPGPVQITAVQRDPERAAIVFHDSSGGTVAYAAAVAYADGVRQRAGARREDVAPKVLAAYILEAAWRTVRRERVKPLSAAWGAARGEPPDLVQQLDTLSRLGRDFARLQEQDVLDHLSPGAIVSFLESIAEPGRALSQVTWDARDKRIVASFV